MDMKEWNNFVSNLKALVAAGKLKKTAVCKELGWGRAYLDRILKDEVDPGFKQCLRLAKCLGHPLATLTSDPEIFRDMVLESPSLAGV